MASYTIEEVAHVRSVLKRINDTVLSKEGWFTFPTESSDGRTNSQQGECKVAEYLLNHPALSGFLVKKANKDKSESDSEDEEDNRAFGDIGIDLSKFGHEPFPCNIKIIAEKNKAGNNACGLTSLVGYTYGDKCRNHKRVMEVIIEVDKKGYDTPLLYGLIMVQKEKKKCWTGTFDEVPAARIGTNPSNPLQVPFLSETERVSRTAQEYNALLVKKIVEYYTKKSQPLALWNSYQQSKKAQ